MINELVQRFKINLEEDGKIIKTIESYIGDTSAFIAFLESKGVNLYVMKHIPYSLKK